MTTRRRDARFLARESPPEDLEVVDTRGSYVIGRRGKRYVDFTMGWCVGNLGWGNETIRGPVRRFRGPDYVYPEYLYKGWAELAELLADIAPGRLRKTARATGGSEAIDFAMQAAMAHTRRRGFLTIEGSYHGDSLAGISIGSTESRPDRWNLLPNCRTIEPPLDDSAVDRVETRLKKRDVAAFIMEPIICSLGVVIPEPAFMAGVSELCRKYGTLLVMDEVACGFGRTGKLFGSEHYRLEPDILCAAKAISGGYGPMGAVIMTAEVAASLRHEANLHSTYGWHPRSVAAAIASVRFMRQNARRLNANTKVMGAHFGRRLAEMKFEHLAQIRVKGLAIGVQFRRRGYTEEIGERAFRAGLLILVLDERTFTLFPALNIPRAVADKGLDILERCLSAN